MSNLFMDMHRRRSGWHNHQNTQPTLASTTTAATAKTTSESPGSTQHNVNDQIISHHNKRSAPDREDAAHNVNYNSQNQNKFDNNLDDDEDDAFANILSLKLRKPKHWKWELTTSKSCTNIALPRIILYDHKGQLLVDANGDYDGVYKQENYEKPKDERLKKRSHQSKEQLQAEYRQRSATTNLTHSIRKALEKDFNSLHIEEATPSPERYSATSISSKHSSHKGIDFNTTDLPDHGLSTRSSSLRGVRFNVENTEDQQFNESHIPEFLPTPPSTTTPTSSSSGPREKRKYRRSQSSGRSSAHSESILERFSYQKGRFSSPEYAEEKEIEYSSRYFLRTCNAGTLVVKEDSFIQHPKRRRRPIKNRSTESLQIKQNSQLSSSSSVNKRTACPTPTNFPSCNRKQQTIRHHKTDKNILLNKQLSTSEEDDVVAVSQNNIMDNVSSARHLRKYPPARNQNKDLKYSTDVHQNGKVR